MKRPEPFYKKSRKRWYVQLGKKQVNLGPDEKEAYQKYHELMAKQADITDDSTVDSLIDKFLDWTEKHREETTYDWYVALLSSFRDSISKRLTVAELRPLHVTNWIDNHFENCGNTRKHQAVTAIKRAMNWAKKEGWITRNPIADVAKPRANRRIAYLTPDQWKAFVKSAQKNGEQEFLDVFTVMKLSGCRPKEARIVEAQWFDPENERWCFPVEKSKGKRESRVVYLSDSEGAAMKICEKWAEENPEGPMFRNSRGRPWTQSAFNCACQRFTKRLGFKVFPYMIRHTFATDAILRGVDLMTIATLMGHKDLKMLTEVYQHLGMQTDHLRQAQRKINGKAAKPRKRPDQEAA